MSNYLQRYRNACSNFDGDEEQMEKEMHQLFTEALEAGDRRMAMELQDSIITAAENAAPVNVIIREYELLAKHFPEIASQTLKIMTNANL